MNGEVYYLTGAIVAGSAAGSMIWALSNRDQWDFWMFLVMGVMFAGALWPLATLLGLMCGIAHGLSNGKTPR